MNFQQLLGIPSKQVEYANRLLESIGHRLSENDQIWLTKHLADLPEYLRSEEGGKVMAAVVDCYRSSLKKLDWQD